MEYHIVTEELAYEQQQRDARAELTSPGETRTVADDLKLHAPKPSLPALSAKQRVASVTRTDSDKAASFGIGRPSHEERASSRDGIRKRPSTSFSTGSDQGICTDEEHGIPEIGQRVPMNPNLGDVQAPSPAPDDAVKHHGRKNSSRHLPPGSYGLHGHGIAGGKLEKDWYLKHPDQLERDQNTPIHDRQNDYAMSKEELNKLVKDTANRTGTCSQPLTGHGRTDDGEGNSTETQGTPTDEVAFHASDEYATRLSSRPGSTAPNYASSPLAQTFNAGGAREGDDVIHVDDAGYPEYRSYGNENPEGGSEEQEYPILASDEVDKNAHLQQPAIHPVPRPGSAFESDDASSRPSSRNRSRPTSIHQAHSQPEFDSTPLEDVQEYEPLFPDESREKDKLATQEDHAARHHFPSKDIWEDAPSSVHYTTQVSTPEVADQHRRKSSSHGKRPLTPAQAFAQHQEELAEMEMRNGGGRAGRRGSPNKFLSLSEEKPTWIAHQPHLRPARAAAGHRFPSRDIWEDAPESQLHQAIITPEDDKEEPIAQADKATSPTEQTSHAQERRPSIPERPKPRRGSSDDKGKTRPAVSDKPKPQVLGRPAKNLSGDSKTGILSKPKPPVPNRPMGGKIAALQGSFLSDLNKRLQSGPPASKKEETASEEAQDEKEKTPLSDARKGRARGPQRRAPAKSTAAPTASAVKPAEMALSFSIPHTTWTMDPENGTLSVDAEDEDVPKTAVPDSTGESETANNALDNDKTIPLGPVQAAEESQRTAKSELPDQSEELKDDGDVDEAKQEDILVSNTAGESVLEATVVKMDGENKVEPVEVDDAVKT